MGRTGIALGDVCARLNSKVRRSFLTITSGPRGVRIEDSRGSAHVVALSAMNDFVVASVVRALRDDMYREACSSFEDSVVLELDTLVWSERGVRLSISLSNEGFIGFAAHHKSSVKEMRFQEGELPGLPGSLYRHRLFAIMKWARDD